MTQSPPTTLLETVTAKIIRAVPEICTKLCDCCHGTWDECFLSITECSNFNDGSHFDCRPITLADVLLALNSVLAPCVVYTSGQIQNNETRETAWWNLTKDSLSEQSEETLAFLNSLLPS